MSVAGIPGFLEERAVFKKERANGLYGEVAFVLSNTLVSAPFLFACAVLFSVISYFAIGLHPGAGAFFRFLAFLYLSLLCAEAQVVLVAALLPVFVAALAISAFLNGFWMSVGGYFIRTASLPHFWRVSFHLMDYQTYAFQLLANVRLTLLPLISTIADVSPASTERPQRPGLPVHRRPVPLPVLPRGDRCLGLWRGCPQVSRYARHQLREVG